MILTAGPWSQALPSLVAAAGYAWLAAASPRLTRPVLQAGIIGVLLVHALAFGQDLFGNPPRFGFAPALSVTAWLAFALYAAESRLYPQMPLRWPLAGLAALSLLLALAFPGSPYPALRSDWLPLHWALGIASYGMLVAAVGHAWLMQRAERSMRQASTQGAGLPLLALERLTFRFVGAGFVLLSATLLAGVWFAVSLDHPRSLLSHKTVFTALSWLTIAALLWGRWRRGWRGRVAVRMLYLGTGLLLLGYVGSRFVLEVVLHRA